MANIASPPPSSVVVGSAGNSGSSVVGLSSTSSSGSSVDSRSVLVSNISLSVEEDHLRDLFAICGTIESITMKGSGPDRLCKIVFAEEDVAKAAAFLTGTPLGDRDLQVTLVLATQQTIIHGAPTANQVPVAVPERQAKRILLLRPYKT